MAALIYSLCALTSLACSVLLWRAWSGSKVRLLFWSGCCFSFLTVNNVLLVIDKVVLPIEVDLLLWRLGAALLAMALLVGGLVGDD